MDVSTLSPPGALGVAPVNSPAHLASSSPEGAAKVGASVAGSDDTLTISSRGHWASLAHSKPFQADLADLDTAISSDDRVAARKAYADLQAQVHKKHEGGHESVGAAFNTLGKALASGDSDTVEDAFETLQAGLKSLHPSTPASLGKAHGAKTRS